MVKLDRAGAAHEEPLAPEDWTMEMTREGSQHIAAVFQGGTLMCRLSVVLQGQDQDVARTLMAEKARRWIKQYLARA